MTCFRTARSLISRNMSAAPPALTLMLSHYWGGLPSSQETAGAFRTSGFPAKYGSLLAAVRFEFVKPQSSFAVTLVRRGLHQDFSLLAILVDAGPSRKALSQ